MKHKTLFILFTVLLIYRASFAQNPASLHGSVISEAGESTEKIPLSEMETVRLRELKLIAGVASELQVITYHQNGSPIQINILFGHS
jgi:hypothetical protein